MFNRFMIPTITTALVASLYSQAADFKIGMVDVKEALFTVDAGKKAKAQLDKELETKQKALEKQQAAIQKEAEAFEKNAGIMNETARAAKQTEIQKKIAEFQKAYQASTMEMQNREREVTKPIIDQLKSIVDGMGKAQGYHLIVEKSEGAVLYAQNATDLTKAVIEAFNKKK